MTRETYLDDAESRDWILDTHAKCLPADWQTLIRRSASAFILYGNEDSPERIEFFGTNTPMNGEAPIVVVGQDGNGGMSMMRVIS